MDHIQFIELIGRYSLLSREIGLQLGKGKRTKANILTDEQAKLRQEIVAWVLKHKDCDV